MKKATLKTKRITHIARMSAMCGYQVVEISKMLGWTEQQYCDHQYDRYEFFLEKVLSGVCTDVYNGMRYSELMRGFWINEWMQRNDRWFLPLARTLLFEGMEVNDRGELLEVYPPEGDTDELREEYLYIHNVSILAADADFRSRFIHMSNLVFKV